MFQSSKPPVTEDIMTPSSIRRIGVSFLLIVIISFFCVLICVYFYFHHDVHIALPYMYIHSLSVAITLSILYPSFMEFVSAQSPYNNYMHGLLQGYVWCIVIFSSLVANEIIQFSSFIA